jgi:hypothetical protein
MCKLFVEEGAGVFYDTCLSKRMLVDCMSMLANQLKLVVDHERKGVNVDHVHHPSTCGVDLLASLLKAIDSSNVSSQYRHANGTDVDTVKVKDALMKVL